MPTTKPIPVKTLRLDLRNFRTVPQKDESSALHAMVSINEDRFWALAESLIDDGYLPTENIIVLEDNKGVLHVREGNRRVGALKVALKYLSRSHLIVPDHIEEKLSALPKDWEKANEEVPCAIYKEKEEALVDKIVTLAHGKGAQAGRDNWNSVARARHNRDKNGASEIGLDLLEKYLKDGRNLTQHEKDLWSGVYPLTVLNELVGKIASRLGQTSSRDLVNDYPGKYRGPIEKMLKDIGNEKLKFDTIRDRNLDFGLAYGLPAPPTPSTTPATPIKTTAPATSPEPTPAASPKSPKALASNDPRSVIAALRSLSIRGKGRSKLVTMRDEAVQLKLNKTPHAFCFVLRAMFEISAKAYCADHAAAGLSTFDKKRGKDKKLVEVLKQVVAHMTTGKPATDPLRKELHGAMTELAKSDGLLSITSLNHLIHSTTFLADERHICTVFPNVFPLLREMNS
jgi:hypothetical protein